MEPITMSLLVLGTAFANEGIKFLWKQADTIVNRYNERKYKKIDKEKEQQEKQAALAQVETGDTPKFLELPPVLNIDFDRVEEKATELGSLKNALTPYVIGDTSPDAADENLKCAMDTLQQIIGYIYHNPIQISEQARQTIVAATAGGKVTIKKGRQQVRGQGEAKIIAEGEGSSVTIGEIDQNVQP